MKWIKRGRLLDDEGLFAGVSGRRLVQLKIAH